jgi:hypothetical protein
LIPDRSRTARHLLGVSKAVVSGRELDRSRMVLYSVQMPKRKDVNQVAYAMVQAIAAGHVPKMEDGKDPLAVALGRRGGLKGGPARAAKMSTGERSASAKKAALARWTKKAS